MYDKKWKSFWCFKKKIYLCILLNVSKKLFQLTILFFKIFLLFLINKKLENWKTFPYSVIVTLKYLVINLCMCVSTSHPFSYNNESTSSIKTLKKYYFNFTQKTLKLVLWNNVPTKGIRLSKLDISHVWKIYET